MEARKLRLGSVGLCRFCLSDDDLQRLYDYDQSNVFVKLNLKILSCVSVEIFPSDHMPQYICKRCIFFMETFFDFKQICRKADECIMRYLEKGTMLKRIPWPANLKKIVEPKRAVKTLEDGTTVQVSYPDGIDSDEDTEHDIYNVKIGDDQAACIKIVSEESNSKKKKSRRPQSKNSSPRTATNQGRMECKFCDKTFTRTSHFMRHVKVKHPNSDETGDSFSCDQCGDVFTTQDDLIYHSAIHATQNLTCPLCLEKFENVDAVTAHIKSHVSGVEFMCDLCELVFLSKEKLDAHLTNAHKDELSGAQEMEHDGSSMEMDPEDDTEDDDIKVQQVGDEMLVQIKKPANFMLSSQEEMERAVTNSEESDQEMSLSEAPPDVAVITKIPSRVVQKSTIISSSATVTPQVQTAKIIKTEPKSDSEANASIIKKAEEIKRKATQKSPQPAQVKKPAPVKQENNNGSSNDKSLRLLEKELQELKRTTTRSEDKTPAKPLDTLRNRRSQIQTSTPKTRAIEERKLPPVKAPAPLKKKLSIESSKDKTKENKEPKDAKDTKLVPSEKESKEAKETKEVKEKEAKEVKEKEVEKETPKPVKNAVNVTEKIEKNEESIRRSSRPSKIKDYAKLLRDKPQVRSDVDSDEYDNDEEYTEEKSPETKKRRSSQKVTQKPVVTPAPAARKRGRPRKDEVPTKQKKEDPEDEKSVSEEEKELESSRTDSRKATPEKETLKYTNQDKSPVKSMMEVKKPSVVEEKPPSGVLVSPTGQTLKQIPIKSLPPGVKPLPLPMTPRPVSSSEVCEMQIGKKVVKVQKIVMTKAEVEAMAKKGLVEMKDGAMVLKQGIKLSTADPNTIKSTLVGDVVNKESPKKPPTRSDPDT